MKRLIVHFRRIACIVDSSLQVVIVLEFFTVLLIITMLITFLVFGRMVFLVVVLIVLVLVCILIMVSVFVGLLLVEMDVLLVEKSRR